MSKAGEFEISVRDGGRPIWAVIRYRGKDIAQIDTLELRSLVFAARQARREAQQIARRMDPDRVEDY